MILLWLICQIIASHSEKRNVFRNDEIIGKELDPNIDTVFDKFIVSFDLDCLRKKKIHRRDAIQEFLDQFECYRINEDIVDLYPNIVVI